MPREQRHLCGVGAIALAGASVMLLTLYIKYMDPSEAEIFLDTPTRVVHGAITELGFQYTGNCLEKKDLDLIRSSRCSVDDEVDVKCKEADNNEYFSPSIEEDTVSSWRRLRVSGRGHTYYCIKRYVPWLKVTVHEGEDTITRCAFRFGTRLNSQEAGLEKAKTVLKGYEVGTTAKFWEQVHDEGRCVLGFDDPHKLGDVHDQREIREVLWSGWLVCAAAAVVAALCTLCTFSFSTPKNHSGE